MAGAHRPRASRTVPGPTKPVALALAIAVVLVSAALGVGGASASGSPRAGGLVLLGSPSVGRLPYLATWNASGGAGGGDVYVANGGGDNVTILAGASVVGSVNVTDDGLGPYDPVDDPAVPSVLLTYHAYGVHGSALHNVSVLYGPVTAGAQAVSRVAGVTASDEPSLGVYDLSTASIYLADLGANVGVLAINATNETVYATIPTGGTSSPHDLVVDPPNGWVYVADLGTSNISIVSGKAVLTTLPVPALANATHLLLNATGETFQPDYESDLAYDPLDGDVYVADAGADRVTVLNDTRYLGNLSVGRFPYSVAYDPDDGDVDVTNLFSDNVSVLHGTSVVGSVPVGRLPVDVAYDAQDGDMLVANLNSSNVTVVAGTTVVGSIPVGTDPVCAIYDTVNDAAYVVDQGSSNVTVLGPPPSSGGSGIPPWGWSVAVLVPLVLILLVVVLITRRRRSPGAPAPAPPPARGPTRPEGPVPPTRPPSP